MSQNTQLSYETNRMFTELTMYSPPRQFVVDVLDEFMIKDLSDIVHGYLNHGAVSLVPNSGILLSHGPIKPEDCINSTVPGGISQKDIFFKWDTSTHCVEVLCGFLEVRQRWGNHFEMKQLAIHYTSHCGGSIDTSCDVCKDFDGDRGDTIRCSSCDDWCNPVRGHIRIVNIPGNSSQELGYVSPPIPEWYCNYCEKLSENRED